MDEKKRWSASLLCSTRGGGRGGGWSSLREIMRELEGAMVITWEGVVMAVGTKMVADEGVVATARLYASVQTQLTSL